MSPRELGMLLGLGAIWGASFMFIKVGGAEIQPFALVEVRLGLAALVMLAIGALKRGVLRRLLPAWRPLVVMGLLNCALPYTLITWGENYVSSGLAAIYNACAPLWAALLLTLLPQGEKMNLPKLVGLAAGFVGVMLVVSASLSGGVSGGLFLVGQGACLLAALSYALSGIYGRTALRGVPSQVAATGQLVTGALMLLPLALLQIPTAIPSWKAVGSVVTLAIAGTALASLMYYWLLSRVGTTRVLLVTYLLPVFALAWGALLLGEAVTVASVVGLVLVLSGVAVTSGTGSGSASQLFGRVRKVPMKSG